MAKYTNEDQKKLEEILEEGLFDRFKARGAQALGAIKGAGQAVKGGLQSAAGSTVSKVGEVGAKAFGGSGDNALTRKGSKLSQKGAENVEAGGNQANNSKIDSYKNSATAKVDALINDIQTDLSKLGIQIDNIQYQNFAKSMKTSLARSLDALKQ